MLPSIPQDTTDRNRTSPLAFTGNKFEFRMPGSSQSIAGPVTILDAIMAQELDTFYETLENTDDFHTALHELIRETFTEHRRIIFGGNGYEEAWVQEAKRRGLANLKNTAQALPAYMLPKNVALLTGQGVYSEEEMRARHEIHMEKYCKILHIEASTLVDMVQHELLNSAREYQDALSQTILHKNAALSGISSQVESSLLSTVSLLSDTLLKQTLALKTALETAPQSAAMERRLGYYHDEIAARMETLSRTIDQLEAVTATKFWPYPSFRELLFSV